MQVAAGARPISEVGEFGLIAAVSNLLAASRVRSAGMLLGPGDDAALWQPRAGRVVCVSTDMLVEGVHFRNDWSDATAIGHRALAVNLSDMAAMGARPRTAIVALALRGTETERWVYDFYRGALALAHKWHVRIIGGDMSLSPTAAVASVTVNGELRNSEAVLRRDFARPGDVIAVTGPLGLAAAGVRALQLGRTRIDGAPAMLAAHRMPQPRILQGMLLVRAGVRCGMDISDGLFGDLPKILEASGVSAEVRADRLPIPLAIRWNFPDWFDLATRGGEDFELLFTAPRDVVEHAAGLFRRLRLPAPVVIGSIMARKGDESQLTLRRFDLTRQDVPFGAYDHFSAKPGTHG
ncbi:MAG: thiamine-phosphate kinase [Chloroflexi bacterium]|nr:MAG: thiamine-phosphate kinase [Chloroflexota bacterium]